MITTTLTISVLTFLLSILTERKTNVSNVLTAITALCITIVVIGVLTQ